MRLGQLARKCDVSVQDLIAYIEEHHPGSDDLHPNARLDDETELSVVQHFKPQIEEEAIEASIEEIIEPDLPDPIETEVEKEEEILVEEPKIEEAAPEDVGLNPIPEEEIVEEAIETDRLLELLESEESSVDLEKITLIKAPKKELEGLKVVGKIELAEPKKPEVKDDELKPRKGDQNRRPLLSEEEREKRRLRAKQKKEQFEARQEKREREREERRKKALKEAHYQQKLQQAKTKLPKRKDKSQKEISEQEAPEQRPAPTSVFGKFWRWLNT